MLCVSSAFAAPLSSLQVFSKDLDGGNPGQNWRRISIRVVNNSDDAFDLRKIALSYMYSDTSKRDTSQVWFFSSTNQSGSQATGLPSDVFVEIAKFPGGLIPTNSSARVRFSKGTLQARGRLEVIFGIHRADWSVVSQTSDPSYLNVSSYSPNPNIVILKDPTAFVGAKLDEVAARTNLQPLQNRVAAPVQQSNFKLANAVLFSRKYRTAAGAIRLVTVDSMGSSFKLDSVTSAEWQLNRAHYGNLSADDRAELDTSTSSSVPLAMLLVPPSPPVALSRHARLAWIESTLVAETDAITSKYHIKASRSGTVLLTRVPRATAISLSRDLAVPRAGLVKSSKVGKDLWAAAFRMNVDFLNGQGHTGSGVSVGIWEDGYPTFADQLAITSTRIAPADFGLCKLPDPNGACKNNTGNAQFGTTYDATTGECWTLENMSITACSAAGGSWVPEADIGYCVGTNNSYIGNIKSLCASPNTWASSDLSSQHIAYMAAAVRNNRTNATNQNFPNNPTYGGNGFAPQATVNLGNYVWPPTSEPNAFFQEQINSLYWLLSGNNQVINQSWHNESPLIASGLPANDLGADPTFFDMIVDEAVGLYHVVFTQAAGNTGKGSYVNHKAANTVIVGQDNRDGYQMIDASADVNGSAGIELPHVTAGVNVCGSTDLGNNFWCSSDQTSFPSGVSMFETSSTGASVVTSHGMTSLASALTAGFTASLISVQPTKLSWAPWTVRAILMASADNIEGEWWSADPTLDQRDGAGRINGINAYLAAQSPYSGTGTAPASGFYSATEPTGTTTNFSLQVVPTQTGNLRIGLSWLAQITQPSGYARTLADLDLTLTGPGPDGASTTWTSSSLANPVEMVHAQVQAGQIYTISVTSRAPVTYDVSWGLAWINR